MIKNDPVVKDLKSTISYDLWFVENLDDEANMVELVLTTHSDDSARQIWQLRQRERVPPINPPKWGEELWTGVAQPGKWEGVGEKLRKTGGKVKREE